uniref:Phytocyanin domain-containing protein n=1 Tax=Brassica campestris TaxID=3711 RepID=M4CS13_BRACM
MSLSFSQTKLLVILVAFACVFSSGSEAWSWSWSSGSGSGSGSGWESHGSGGSASGSGTNPDGSHWSWKWDTQSGWRWRTCNFESRNKIASSEENGSKESFKFTLAMSQPYSFACGEDNGYYCRTYNMKFSVLPGA